MTFFFTMNTHIIIAIIMRINISFNIIIKDARYNVVISLRDLKFKFKSF